MKSFQIQDFRAIWGIFDQNSPNSGFSLWIGLFWHKQHKFRVFSLNGAFWPKYPIFRIFVLNGVFLSWYMYFDDLKITLAMKQGFEKAFPMVLTLLIIVCCEYSVVRGQVYLLKHLLAEKLNLTIGFNGFDKQYSLNSVNTCRYWINLSNPGCTLNFSQCST